MGSWNAEACELTSSLCLLYANPWASRGSGRFPRVWSVFELHDRALGVSYPVIRPLAILIRDF